MVQTALRSAGASTPITDDDEECTMSGPESQEVVLARMDGRLGVLEEGLKELRSEVRGGFAGLTFVRDDVYRANRDTDKEHAAETRRIAEQARTVAFWALGFVISATAALLAVIRAVAG